MAKKRTSTFRDASMRRVEYIKAMENRDRPQWPPEKLEDMKKNFDNVIDELVKLDQCVIDTAHALGIPAYRRLDLMRIVRRAWKLVRKKESPRDYVAEITFMTGKYGFDIGTVNRVLEACGLPTIA